MCRSLKSARSKRTTRTRVTRPSEAPEGVDQRTVKDDHGKEDGEDVLVDALAEFMRPASQSTIRTRQTLGRGSISHKGASGANGLTQKQLAALERIEEHIEDASADEGMKAKRRRSAPVLGPGAPGRTPRGSLGRYGPKDAKKDDLLAPAPAGGGVASNGGGRAEDNRQGSLARIPRIKGIRCGECIVTFRTRACCVCALPLHL